MDGVQDLQRFRTAMDATADAIFLVDRTTMRFVEVNAAATRMLGYSREELLAIGPEQVSRVSFEQLERVYDAVIAGHGTGELSETTFLRKDGTDLRVEATRQAQRSGAGWMMVEVMRDITERQETQARLERLSHHDALTSLPNRPHFQETLRNALARGVQGGWRVAVLCIGLDHFKRVNDTLGRAGGDALLALFANRLTQCVRSGELVGRLGGGEFAVIQVMQDEPRSVASVAAGIQECLRAPFDVKGHRILLTTSIGIAIQPDDGSGADTLLKFADTAMHGAKRAGRDTFRFSTAQMNIEALARLEMDAALRKAVENEEFVLHYQPRAQLDGGGISGVEALIRWERPGHGLVSPGTFLPHLEATGLIVGVGGWVIDSACAQIAAWMRTPIGAVQVSVNISTRQFVDGGLDVEVARLLALHGIPAHLLELELTQASLLADGERSLAILGKLKALGVRLSTDDFGSGYASLGYLRRFPIDRLKIDIAFIRDLTLNPEDASIVLAIIRMAHGMKIEAIAEGVETAAQLSFLRRHGCDHIQGYYFSPPLPREGIEQLLLEGRHLPHVEGEPGTDPKTLLLVGESPRDLEALDSVLRHDGYRILCASSPAGAFEVLSLHRVHVIAGNHDMAGLRGLLDRVHELYPDTFRLVLSGADGTRQNVREAFRHASVPYRTDDPRSTAETDECSSPSRRGHVHERK